jgi:bacteriorhodopsin
MNVSEREGGHVAEIDVVPKRRASMVYWIVAAVVLLLVAWWLVTRSETAGPQSSGPSAIPSGSPASNVPVLV